MRKAPGPASFDEIYTLDLAGNVRKNPKLSGTTHNVFGIQVGVSINIFVRKSVLAENRKCKIHHATTNEFWTRGRKELYLAQVENRDGVEWTILVPDSAGNWLTDGLRPEFTGFRSITDVFSKQSRGVATSRDAWAYNSRVNDLAANIEPECDFYNKELYRFMRAGSPNEMDSFVDYDDGQISWSRDLKQDLQRGRKGEFSASKIRSSLYRPYTSAFLFLIVYSTKRFMSFHRSFRIRSPKRKSLDLSDRPRL